jgi:hypothetical protein
MHFPARSNLNRNKHGVPALYRCFVAMLLVASGLLPDGAQARDTAPPTPVLDELNTNFRALLGAPTAEVLQALPLVLVVQNNTITAVRGNQRRLYPVPLQRYSDARSIMHAALGFHGLMNTLAHDDELTEADWSRVEALLRDIERTEHALTNTQLTRKEKQLAARALDTLAAACRRALETRVVTPAAVATTLRRSEPALSALSTSVGHAHAEALVTVLRQVQAHATPQEWKEVVAVVTGPMTPRRNNLETAAVASVLGKEQLGTRIFYSENIFDVDGALSFLQTLVGDRELSQAVFGTPHRMWEDLFAPVAGTLVEGDFYTELAK